MIVGVPVEYNSPDLVAFISAIYVCDCGKKVSEYGRHAGELPPHWVGTEEGRYLCEYCASRLSGTTQAPAQAR